MDGAFNVYCLNRACFTNREELNPMLRQILKMNLEFRWMESREEEYGIADVFAACPLVDGNEACVGRISNTDSKSTIHRRPTGEYGENWTHRAAEAQAGEARSRAWSASKELWRYAENLQAAKSDPIVSENGNPQRELKRRRKRKRTCKHRRTPLRTRTVTRNK